MNKTSKKHSNKHKTKSYAQIINPIHHLEKTMIKLDAENDKLQKRTILLSFLSLVLAVLSIILALSARL